METLADIKETLGGGTMQLRFRRKGEWYTISSNGPPTNLWRVVRSNGAEYVFPSGEKIRAWLERMEPV